jgi:hypothetical protein
MKNSFEEKVVMIEERKKDLAALTFSNEKISEQRLQKPCLALA